MIGKKNIVFGFIYLVFTAALGPFMVVSEEQIAHLEQEKEQAFQRLEQLANTGSPEDLAKGTVAAIIAAERAAEGEGPIEHIKSGPHAHGNLEALLNITAGVVLCFIALAPIYKQVISWLFIAGAVLHSGMLYVGVLAGQTWAWKVIVAGPPLLLIALLAIGAATAMGFRGQIVYDRT